MSKMLLTLASLALILSTSASLVEAHHDTAYYGSYGGCCYYNSYYSDYGGYSYNYGSSYYPSYSYAYQQPAGYSYQYSSPYYAPQSVNSYLPSGYNYIYGQPNYSNYNSYRNNNSYQQYYGSYYFPY